MIKIHGFTVHHAAFLTLWDGTMILPAGAQELVYDHGGLTFRLVQRTRHGPEVLRRFPVATVATAKWY